MAMTLDTAIKFTAKLEGQGLDQLKRGLQGMAQQANRSSKDLDRLYAANKKLAQAAGGSLNSLQRQITVMTNLRNEAQIGSRQFKFYTAELQKLERQQAKLTGATRGGGLLSGVGGLQGLALAAGGGLAVKFVADVGLQAESAQVRLQALADEFGEYNQAQEAAARIAQTLRISNTEAQQSFASLYASLRPTGITIQELEKAFIGFSAAARNSGATAQETSNALIQLRQGLASGVLQGEELRSIREQAPLAAQAIAKELGVSIGELKELASEGQVTTDVVLRALGKLQDAQVGKLNRQFQTGAQALVDLQNELRRAGEGIAKAFGPTAIALLRAFTSTVQRVSDALGLVDGATGRREDRIRADLQAQKEARDKFGIGGFFRYGFEIDRFQNQRSEELFNQFQAQRQRQQQQTDTPSADQQAAREAAAAERESARQRAAKEALEEEVKIRKDAENKLADAAQRNAEQIADFQRETIKRAIELERDLGDERLKIERQIADTRTKLQQTLEDRALEAERQRLAAAGLSTEGIETAKEVKEIFRRYDEQRIENERGAVDAQTDLQRRLEEFKISVAEGIGKLQEGYARQVSNILQDAGEKLAEKMKQGATAAAATLGSTAGGMTTAMGPMAPGAIIARTGNTGQSTGPHLDARWADGRPISAADVDRYLRVNGRAPSSFGVTSPYGPRNLFGRSFHSGVDFGTPSGSGISLQNGAQVLRDLGFTGAGGYAVEIDTPQGRMRLLHLQGNSVQRAAAAPAAAPSAAVTAAMAGVTQAGANLNEAQGALNRQQQLLNEQQTVAALEQQYGAITSELDQQRRTASEKLRDELRYSELLKQGISPEIAKLRAELEGVAAIEKLKLEALQTELEARIATLSVESDLRKELEKQVEAIKERLRLQGQIVDKTIQESEAEKKAREEREKAEKRAAEWKQLYADIGGTLSEGLIGGIDAAIEAAMTGSQNLGDTLKGIASGVLKDIGNMLLRFGLNSLLGGAFGGGFFKFANGGVMTGSGPAPLKRYAQGGIANRPQLALYGEGSKPEAYVPLPDGRRIPVALQGQDKMREAMGAGPTQGMGAPVLNMSFQTTSIGGVEYVSRDQLEAAMAETRRAASRDGAKRGMTMTLDKLQQSPSTRTRVGLR